MLVQSRTPEHWSGHTEQQSGQLEGWGLGEDTHCIMNTAIHTSVECMVILYSGVFLEEKLWNSSLLIKSGVKLSEHKIYVYVPMRIIFVKYNSQSLGIVVELSQTFLPHTIVCSTIHTHTVTLCYVHTHTITLCYVHTHTLTLCYVHTHTYSHSLLCANTECLCAIYLPL